MKVQAGEVKVTGWFLRRGMLLTKWAGVMTPETVYEAMQGIRQTLARPHLIEVADCRSALWAMTPDSLVAASKQGRMCRVPVAVVVTDAQLEVATEAARQLCLAGYTLRAFTSDLQALVWADARLQTHHVAARDPRCPAGAAGAGSPAPSA